MRNTADITTVNREKIRMYAKQLRLPTFLKYDELIRQLSSNDGYEEFLIRLMKNESDERQHSGQLRRIKAARFPFVKTLDEFDTARLEHVSDSFIRELASGNCQENRTPKIAGKCRWVGTVGAHRMGEWNGDMRAAAAA